MFIECEAKSLNYQDLKTALINDFASKITSASVHEKLHDTKKRESESVREYLYRMINIASQADIDDMSIISYVIEGIRDSVVNKTILYGAKTMAEFKERLLVYEKIKLDTCKNSIGKVEGIKKDFKKDNEKRRRCFNCGASSHEFHSCPEKGKGPKCFKCNQYGHKREQCKFGVTREEKIASVLKRSDMYQPVKINSVLFEGLIDTGSDICLVKERYVKDINPRFICKENAMNVNGLGAKIRTKGTFLARIELGGATFEQVEIHVGGNEIVGPDIIIGMNVLQKALVTIDGKDIKITKRENKSSENEREVNNNLPGCFLSEIKVDVTNDICLLDLSHLGSKELIPEIGKLVRNYHPQPPNASPIQMKIILSDETPIYQRPRRFPPKEQKIIDEQIEEWLKNGIITESSSDYTSNVLLVKKKDGSHRLCVDYRRINKKIYKEHYPLPVIEDQIDKLQGAQFFTTLDLENGFFHVNIEEGSRKFTSFVTQNGQYEFLRVPFGLCNSPSVFQKYINFIFRNLIKEGVVIVYIDDIIIPSTTIEEGVSRLKKTLQVAAENGLKIKWKKCQILKSDVEYLGYRICKGNVYPSREKVKAVLNFPVPTTAKQLQSFMGLASYFRKFIPEFALKAKPLTDLLKKDSNNLQFGENELKAFEILKQELAKEPVLRIFRYGAATELHTDASKFGLAAVLLQRGDDDNTLHPVYYWSKKTSKTEQNYSSYELEAMAIVEAVKKFRIYLLGQRFKIITDCKAFECTLKKKDLTTRVARWAMLLEEFEYDVEHRAGSRLKHVDALSRNPTILCINLDNGFLRKLQQSQRKDDKINAIIQLLQDGSYKDYVMQHNILCKKINNKLLFVVPDQMKTNVIREVHEKGHFHLRKMKEIIEREFYIDNLTKRIEKYITSCIRCILAERKSGKAESLLHPIPKGDVPLDTFHIDHVGPMQDIKKNYKYIFSIIDGFTKYCWLFPTKTLGADEVIQKFEIVADTFGYPRRIIADRGGAFRSVRFQEFCKNHDIKLHLTTTGAPRGNGQIERLHSTVTTALTKLSMNNHEKWYTYVKALQRTLNSTFQRAIDTTPFELLVGTMMRTEQEVKMMEIIQEEFQKSFEDNRDEQRRKERLEISKIQEKNRQSFNKKRKEAAKYQVGDLVAVERTQFGTALKIRAKYFGPYEVIAIRGFDRYKVKKVGEHEGPKITEVCADKMKRWVAEDEDIDTTEDEVEREEEPIRSSIFSGAED